MKTRLKNLFLGTGIFLICGAPTMNFDAMFPAQLPLPDNIKTIAIIDRSARESKIGNIIEGGLTGEGIGQDKEASRRLIDGLIAQVNRSGKYTLIRTNIEMKIDQGAREFSKPLPWAHVKGICMENKADAVLSLEYFDTDHIGEHLDANVGIRIYSGINNEIIDEYTFTNSVHVARRSDDLVNLVSKYISNDVVLNLSYESGIIYGQRISPYWLRVQRKYYKRSKGDNDFALGARMMEVNDWNAAIAAFETCLDSSKKRKTLGRASHNLAVINEILGDHQKAKEYAQLAWGNYKNKDSKEYSYILTRRMAELERLRSQEN